jgi:hypothetical protein
VTITRTLISTEVIAADGRRRSLVHDRSDGDYVARLYRLDAHGRGRLAARVIGDEAAVREIAAGWCADSGAANNEDR